MKCLNCGHDKDFHKEWSEYHRKNWVLCGGIGARKVEAGSVSFYQPECKCIRFIE